MSTSRLQPSRSDQKRASGGGAPPAHGSRAVCSVIHPSRFPPAALAAPLRGAAASATAQPQPAQHRKRKTKRAPDAEERRRRKGIYYKKLEGVRTWLDDETIWDYFIAAAEVLTVCAEETQ